MVCPAVVWTPDSSGHWHGSKVWGQLRAIITCKIEDIVKYFQWNCKRCQIELLRGVNSDTFIDAIADTLLLQVPPLVQELRALSPNIKSTLAASVLKQLETGVFAGIKEKTRNSSEKKNKVYSPVSSRWS